MNWFFLENKKKIITNINMTLKIILQQHWTEVRFANFLSSGFTIYYGSKESQINTYLGFFVEIGAENTGTPNAPKFVCPSPKV